MSKPDIVNCLKCGRRAESNEWQFCPYCGKKLPDHNLPKNAKAKRAGKGQGSVVNDKRTGKFIARIKGDFVGSFFTEKDAWLAIERYKAKNNIVKDGFDSSDTLQDIFERYIAECYEKNLTEGAIKGYISAFKYFPDKVKNKRMIDVNVEDFNAAKNEALRLGRKMMSFKKLKPFRKVSATMLREESILMLILEIT